MQSITIREIQTQGQQTCKPEAQTMSADRYFDTPAGAIVGEQGDLYFAKLDAVPVDCLPWPWAHRQLAPGTTQGSRHVVQMRVGTLWLLRTPTPLDGPIIEAPAGCVITHPEHGDHHYPAGIYRVTYQRAYATELRRIAD